MRMRRLISRAQSFQLLDVQQGHTAHFHES